MSTTPISSTSDPTQWAENLRREMRSIRRELGTNVEELVENAERLMDWRYYVERYPWAMVGAAALLGYFVVPRRTVTMPVDGHSLDALAQRIAPALSARPERAKQETRPGWISSLISMGTGMVMRAAVGYATQHLSQYLNRMANPPSSEPRPYSEEAHPG
jgi:hypothetical protein